MNFAFYQRTIAGSSLTLLILAGVLAAAPQDQEKATPLSKVERLDRAPISKEVLHVQLPRPLVAKLPNGVTLVLLEDHKLPTVALTLWIRPGQLADPVNLPGLATFTADMLREGTQKRTSLEISAEADSLGATLGANARFGQGFTVVNAAGLAENTPQLLDLLSDIVLHPAFAPSELAIYKEREGAALEGQLANSVFVGQQAFRRVLYGDGPLAMAAPTKESLAKVAVDDLKRFHDQHYVPGNAILGAVGDFRSTEMRAQLEKYFGAWAGAAEPTPTFADRTRVTPTSKITLVDRPGSVQTYIMAGNRGIRRTDPDYFSLQVMNQILGGGAQSRLFLDLREVHGYTYGAYSNTNADIYPGDWAARAAVRTPVTDPSMAQFLYEFKRVATEPVPQSELDDARHAIVAAFALSLEQPAQLLAEWMTVQYYGLPADYWDKYPDRIAAVDTGAVQAAAKKFVSLDTMQWVCVGDRKQIESALAKYGPVDVVDVEGRPQK